MNRYLSVFTNRRMLVTLILGFSCGLPLALVGSTMQAWLDGAKLDITSIGQFALVGLPYSMKFLWAPFLDIRPLPFLGLRRGWMAVFQVGLCLSTFTLGTINPANAIGLFSVVALLLAFFSASQDIVVDAYRTEIIEDKAEYGAGASTYITGYRIAMLVSGGVAMGLSDIMSWKKVYMIMALVNLVGLVTVLCSKEPKVVRKNQKTSLREGIAQPFVEFFQRHGAMEVLIFIMIYKISTLMATALTTKFLRDLHYTNTMIGSVNKVAGLIATIAGTIAGGALMAKLGLKRSLWFFGIVQSLVGLTFCLLARISDTEIEALKHLYLVAIVSMDNFMMGLGTAALTGFMMMFSNRLFTGTQMALLTSVMAVSRVILISQAGALVDAMGWDMFFISTVPLAIPGLLMLYRFDHWQIAATTKKSISRFEIALIGMFVISLIALSSDPIWKAMGLKELGKDAVYIGAIGVVLVVLISIVKPYIVRDNLIENS